MESEEDEYWFCIIGPAKRSELPSGADGPMRMAIESMFEKISGHYAEECSSGWGLSKEDKEVIQYAKMKQYKKVNNIKD